MALTQLLTWEQSRTLWAQELAPAINNPLTVGVLLTDVKIGVNDTVIKHGLNRQPQGWFVVDITQNANVWRTAWDKNSITLKSSVTDLTTSLWVF